jgi:uncharacterized protein (TIGR02391 family)
MPLVSIDSIIPNAEDLLALEPEELAGVLLEHLNSLDENSQFLHLYNFLLPGQSPAIAYPQDYREPINRALTEAWVWLEREGLIAPRPGNSANFMFVTRRGKALANRKGLNSYRHANLFPKTVVHPVIVQKVYPAFLRGEYDTAIFQAFREVEVAVRDAGGYSQSDVGVPLMRAAFNVSQGTLTDKAAVQAEQQAMSDLFAGAIGSFKNPASHRSQTGIQPAEAVERIMLASHLLRIVEERRAAIQSQAGPASAKPAGAS